MDNVVNRSHKSGDLSSPGLLKFKGGLFVFLALLSGGLLLAPAFTWRAFLLLSITVWASCRAYYFCFYVMHNYVDPTFRYAGLFDMLKRLIRRKP